MSKKMLTALLAAVMVMSLTACGGGSSETAAADTTAQAAAGTETEEAESGAAESGEEAELGGTLTVYMPSPTDLNTAYIEGFEGKNRHSGRTVRGEPPGKFRLVWKRKRIIRLQM